jgi:hypothetical protein
MITANEDTLLHMIAAGPKPVAPFSCPLNLLV